MCDGLAWIRAERGQTSGWRGLARTNVGLARTSADKRRVGADLRGQTSGWRGQFKMCFSDRRGLLKLLFTQSRNNLILFQHRGLF